MVKRYLVVLALSLVLCFGGGLSVRAQESGTICFLDVQGKQLRFLAAGDISVQAKLPAGKFGGLLAAGKYDGDTLLSVTYTFVEEGSAQLTLDFSEMEIQGGCYLRAFLWDREMRPLSPVYTLIPPLDSAEVSHPNGGKYFAYLFPSWDRGRLNESESVLTAAVKPYLEMDEVAFLAYVNSCAEDVVWLNSRSQLEILAQRMCMLYRQNGNPLAARRGAEIMYRLAKHYPSVQKEVNGSAFNSYDSCLPVSCVYGYDCIYGAEEVWQMLFDETGENYQSVIEDWFRNALKDYHAFYDGMFFGNVTPYGIKNAVGVAMVLNDPDEIRKYLAWADRLMSGIFFHSDGMWGEGSLDYHKTVYNNMGELVNLLAFCYKDPADYPEPIDYKNLRSRWPMLEKAGGIQKEMRFPDGRKIAVNDTAFENSETKSAEDPILSSCLKNIVLNHFGFYALTRGDTADAAQISLSLNPQAEGLPYSGGHYHANPLGITLWGGGMEVLPDAGYPYERRSNGMFHTSAPAHNCLWVWNADTADTYEQRGGESTRAALLAYDDGHVSQGKVMLVEGSQPGPKGDGAEIKRRMLLSVQTEGNRSYFVDIGRLKGGDAHELYLRAAEEEDCILKTDLPLEQKNGTLESYLKETGHTEGLELYRNLMRTPQVGDGSRDFRFSWTGEKSGTTLSAYLGGVPEGEIYFSRIPTLRRTQNKTELQDAYPGWHLYRRRLVAADEVTRYAGVYEVYRKTQEPQLRSVTFKEPVPEQAMAGTIVVRGENFTDIIYYSDDTVPRTVEDCTFWGQAAMLRTDKNGNSVWGYVYGEGGLITAKGEKLCGMSDQTVQVAAAEGNTITLAEPLKSPDAGQWMTVFFGDGSGYGMESRQTQENAVVTKQSVSFVLDGDSVEMLYYPATQKGTYEPRRINGGAAAVVKTPVFEKF